MTEPSEPDRVSVEFLSIATSQEALVIAKEDEKAFEDFCNLRMSQFTMSTVGFIFSWVTMYVYGLSLVHPKSWKFLGALIVIGVLVRNPLGLMLVLYKKNIDKPNPAPFYVALTPWYPSIICMLSVFSSLHLGLYLIARVLNGRCESLDQLYVWSCNSEYDARALPQELVVGLMMMPLMFAVAFKAIRRPFIMLTWAINILCIVISIIISGATQSIPALVAYMPLSCIVLYEIHRQNIILFLVVKKQKLLLNANKKLSEETQNELRFMIANMAHDLKTPLSAFMNGVETLTSVMGEVEKLGPVHTSLFTQVKEGLKNLHTVNSFMTMTVNRCIDYMKASKGIKLEPRLETINLQEVLSMPLNCMRDLQSRITIRQNPIPVNVCSHIITDLQWFQENLFCLISNAVKYSSHGHISVSVSLTPPTNPIIMSAKRKKKSLRIVSRATSAEGDEGVPPCNRPLVAQYSFLDRMSKISSNASEDGQPEPNDDGGDLEKGLPTTTRLIDEMNKPRPVSGIKKLSPRRVYVAPPAATKEASLSELEDSDGPLLLVEVEDTGIGLSDEVKETLFTPFKQAQRRAGGTGLGLYSLAKRVDALGGYYGVSNRRDGEQGSIFWFAIPYRPDMTRRMSGAGVMAALAPNTVPPKLVPVDPDLSVSSVTEAVTPTTAYCCDPSSPKKLRILLVDDSLTILKMTSNLLKRHGHVVDQEENGADALSRLEKTRNSPSHPPYDVMLIDLNMPVMDGLEAMKRLRELERELNSRKDGKNSDKFHQRVFAFSANSDRETMAEAMAAGADDFICKPFSIQTFNEKVDKLG